MIRALDVSHRCCFTVYFNFVLDQIDILRLIHHRPQCECHRDLDPRGTCIMPCSTSEVVILVVMVRLSSLFDEFFQGNRWPTCTVTSANLVKNYKRSWVLVNDASGPSRADFASAHTNLPFFVNYIWFIILRVVYNYISKLQLIANAFRLMIDFGRLQ